MAVKNTVPEIPAEKIAESTSVVKIVEAGAPEIVTEQRNTPYGCINVYPGIRTTRDKYTCPLLSIHLYEKTKPSNDASSIQERKRRDQKLSKQEATAKVEILMIPIEDIIQITVEAELQKRIQIVKASNKTSTYKKTEGCCNRCVDCLRKCCCCCCRKENKSPFLDINAISSIPDINLNRKSKKRCCQRLRDWCCGKIIAGTPRERVSHIVTPLEGQRVVKVTIEYSKYSHLETPSHVGLLSGGEQQKYYQKKFDPYAKLNFYLIKNTEYESDDFETKMREAETLSRVIMQLKAMADNYPSKRDLEMILDQSSIRTFGDEFKEPDFDNYRSSTTNTLHTQSRF